MGLARKSHRPAGGQRQCVLPNVALRSLQVLVMLVKNGGCMLADDELQDKPTAVHQPAARVYTSTLWRCDRRGSVLHNVALRSVRVSSLLVLLRHRGNGGCKLGFWGAVEGRAADG